MNDLAWPIAAVALWFVLMRWVLPWLGMPTCMSGCCGGNPAKNEACDHPKEPLPTDE